MIGLLQRVSQASVAVDSKTIASINRGLLVLVGVEKNDDEARAKRLLEKLIGYRVFGDADEKMNLSLSEVGGELLLVPQFTLPADTRKGLRPSFTPAASAALGEQLFTFLASQAAQTLGQIQTGRFGANMQVHLVNDGPVTFWLQT